MFFSHTVWSHSNFSLFLKVSNILVWHINKSVMNVHINYSTRNMVLENISEKRIIYWYFIN